MCFYGPSQEEDGDDEPLEGLSQPEHTFEEVWMAKPLGSLVSRKTT